MKNEFCIFDSSKKCNNCNECNLCDLDRNKICNNCGRCLEVDGIDIKAVNIAEVATNEYESSVFEQDLEDTEDIHYEVENKEEAKDSLGSEDYKDAWDFIEDIDELQEIIDDDEKFNHMFYEEFPGLIKLKKDGLS